MASVNKVNYKGTVYDIVGDELATKANVDGVYEGMTVGNAEQIVSSIIETDKDPYLFRTTAGNKEAGNRKNMTIVGGSLPWNQLVPTDLSGFTLVNTTLSIANGIFALTPTRDTSYQKTAAVKNVSALNHVYFYSAKDITMTTETTAGAMLGFFNSASNATLQTIAGSTISDYPNGRIYKPTTDFYFGVRMGNASVQGDVAAYTEPHIIDLTLLFGSTIADYIYSLEQGTAGAGVAWFKKYFPKDYYPYNAGELMHVSGLQSHDTVGFNQWDEEWELGTYDLTSGLPQPSAYSIRGKNRFEIIPNTTYYANNNYVRRLYYDANDDYISFKAGIGVDTTPSNAKYMRIYLADTYGTTYNHDICIHLHWDGERDGEYEEYAKRSYPLDDYLTLRGIPKLDTNNNLYYDGDVYESDGTVTRKYGIVDLGTLTWTMAQAGLFWVSPNGIATVVEPPYSNRQLGAICSAYPADSQNTLGYSSMTDKSWLRTTNRFYVKDSAYASVSDFKTAMSGVYLVYELATPTTEQAEPYQNPQIVDNWGTEEYVTDSIVPVGHITEYPVDLKAKLEASADNPSADGVYLLQYQNGQASYTPLASNATIANIISRLEALEGGTE